MKLDDFNKVVERRIALIKEVLTSKGQEYVRGDDRLHNFKNSGRKKGVTPEKALTFFMLKHETSLDDIINDLDRGIIPSQKMIDEKIGDIINYYVLLEAHFAERIAEAGNVYEKSAEAMGTPAFNEPVRLPLERLPEDARVLHEPYFNPIEKTHMADKKADEICEREKFTGPYAPFIRKKLVEIFSNPVVANADMVLIDNVWQSRCTFTKPLGVFDGAIATSTTPYTSVSKLAIRIRELQS